MTEVPPSTAPPSALDRAATDASAAARRGVRLNPRAVITGVLFVAIIGLAIWCLARPEPLLVQGESGEHADRHRRARLRPAGEDRGQPWSERRGGCDPFGYRQSRTGRRVAPSRSRKNRGRCGTAAHQGRDACRNLLDEDADALTLAVRRLDQAKLAYDEAVRGFTAEEHEIAEANVGKAAAKVDTVKARSA